MQCDELWRGRLERLRTLPESCRPAGQILRFYEQVLVFQEAMAIESSLAFRPGAPLREQIDLSATCHWVESFLPSVIKYGPDLLCREARELQQGGETAWLSRLRAVLSDSGEASVSSRFVALVCLQPSLEALQLQLPAGPESGSRVCPACGSLPLLSILRPEGSGAGRWLQCFFCLREWRFRRLSCLWCEESDDRKLTHYSADEFLHVRVEACETCKRYLKAVDLSVEGRAVPIVDEVATAALDLWAREHGYTKIAVNLMGF